VFAARTSCHEETGDDEDRNPHHSDESEDDDELVDEPFDPNPTMTPLDPDDSSLLEI
jgi:hypothetical protein